MNNRIEFKLLENALDYVLSAAENAQKGTPRNLKYSILHLTAGVELLLKARLEKEHWSLLFSDVDKANQTSLRIGDFKSVEFEVACLRLMKIANVILRSDEIKSLKKLREVRNKIQHFAIDIDVEQAKSILGKGLNFVLEFVYNNIRDQVTPYDEQINAIKVQLSDFDAFIKARLIAIKPQLEAVDRLIECPLCLQETMTCEDGEPHCFFCYYKCDFESLALERSETGEVRKCPNCDEIACTFVVYNNDECGWYCVACDTGGDYSECPRCEVGLVKGNGGVCSACWKEVLNKDD